MSSTGKLFAEKFMRNVVAKNPAEGEFHQAVEEVVESLICELSPALGVHSGPGTVGFCFFPVQKR